jgi:2-dehydropantoate 2-reductase
MDCRNVAIIGAGPVGGILAAHLCSAGHEVSVVDAWKEHVETIRSNGLRIRGRQDLHVRPAHLFVSIKGLGNIAPEFIFICTKACDLDMVLAALSGEPGLTKAVLISMQNGIDTEQLIAGRMPGSCVLRGVLSFGGVVQGLGEIRQTFFNPPNHLGWLEAKGEAPCVEVAEFVSASGLTMEATGEIQKFVWRKAILNTCTMAIAAVTGMNMQEMIEFPPTNELVDLLLDESIAVAAAHGFDYGPGFVDMVKDFNRRAGAHKPSMLTDLELGRRTENAFLIRRIAEYAEKKGVPAPYHRTMADLIDALEMRGLQRSSGKNG